MIKPVHPVMFFPGASVVDAFMNMQGGEHIGKMVINILQDLADLSLAPVAPKLQLRPEVSYLLVGGLRAVGKGISTWMVECGARHLIYLARSAGIQDKFNLFSSSWLAWAVELSIFLGAS
jgi:KR domain